jgi:protein-S-isoprenylcysteine O-methyltransferase Ste14
MPAAELLALERAALLLGPAAAATALVWGSRPIPREATAAMVAFLWQLPALLLLHLLATRFGWWRFDVATNALLGLPVDVWIGWALWWGPVAAFALRWVPAWALVVASIAIDLATMPGLAPLVEVGPDWWVGDAVAMALCLAPALWFARLTREDRLPRRRAMFHSLGWGGYMVLVLPACALTCTGRGLADLYRLPATGAEGALLAAVAFLLFVGVAATAEFARAGDGTPIPLDPPKRVVVTGPYAFVANPMQVISAAVMLMFAAYARSWALALVGAMFFVFDTVYATWYNRAHISRAMPAAWGAYRGEVDEWRLRWRPHAPGAAQVEIAPDGPARRVWDRGWPWLSRHLVGRLAVRTVARGEFTRLTYRLPERGIEEVGIRAVARILEHGPLPLAVLGWLLRFPYLGGALQRLSALVLSTWRGIVHRRAVR